MSASGSTDSDFVDLRSDTYTKPSLAMRQAMFEAEVGDDMVGEDPTVNRLEAMCCELFGKPAAVFCCSATQSNQAALWAQCRSGDEILIEQYGHLANYEAGAPAVLSGVSIQLIPGDQGMLDVSHLEGRVRPREQHFPQTKVLCLENTTNIGGGRAYPLEQLQRVTDWGRDHGLRCHLDGARIFNACTARGYSPAETASMFDTISVCFSKGLGCPMGSILVGDEETIAMARRARKIFGGALRQAGIVAAAAIYALDNHIDQLAEDHRNAYRLAERLEQIPGLHINLADVETNIVFFRVDSTLGSAKDFAGRLRERGVRMYDIGPGRMRAVTHRDVTVEMIDRAADVIEQVARESC
ncbi:threonine aldolase family protein [Rubinisphaera margarita]|uniref:threonine aldolase family protein n=1 Tax=Rubinisphaera margarita TaxID=2909586 RepID=UPI001EE91A39|nr:GntG family PLP-dependent aldolase [Rubinisphaera margarita]MCG6156435.1 aminotransferase class I/II-fold pyridoxal phosphate-dependent enzyme [Rubinisphaera margarita]